jgi:B12-binding domain/radical SAM domain protein
VRRAKTPSTAALFFAGGPHPSGDPAGTLQLGFDVVCKGEGEIPFPLVVERWPTPITAMSDIPNLVLQTSDGPLRTPRAPVIDLDAYPPLSLEHGWTARPIEITRGCPHACAFCQTPWLFGGRMRHRSVQSVADFLDAALRSPKPPRRIRFVTPDAFAYGSDGHSPDPAAAEELLRAVAARVGPERVYFGSFPSETRPENVTPDMLRLVTTYAANDNIIIGAQSGSQRLLDAIHRGHTVVDVYAAVKHTLAAGLEPRLDFIFGLPGETANDRRQTRLVIEELAALGARIHTHYFMPLPGTPLSGHQPDRLDGDTRRLVSRLTGKGQMYGQWQRQREIAHALVAQA